MWTFFHALRHGEVYNVSLLIMDQSALNGDVMNIISASFTFLKYFLVPSLSKVDPGARVSK